MTSAAKHGKFGKCDPRSLLVLLNSTQTAQQVHSTVAQADIRGLDTAYSYKCSDPM